MSKKNQYDKDDMFEQNESGYYYPPVFRYPSDEEADEDMRQHSTPKNAGPAGMGPTGGLSGMGAAGGGGIEPGMKPFPTGTLEGLPVTPGTSQMQPTLQDIGFTQAFLRQNVGKRVRLEFLIGTNLMVDKSGTLLEVGISYVVIRDFSGTRVMGDIYSIKFANIYD